VQHLLRLARDDARLAQAAIAVATTVGRCQAGPQGGLQHRLTTFDKELVAGGLDGDMRRHDTQHVVHHLNRVGRRLAAQHLGKTDIEKVGEVGNLLGGRRAADVIDAFAQCLDQVVVMRQMTAHIFEFFALQGEALREDFLIRQHALANALAEGLVANLGDALERTGILQAQIGIDALQILGGHAAIERRQFARGDLPLQHGPRHADQMRRTRQGEQLGHARPPLLSV